MVQPRGFVDRQRQLAQLNRFLDRALAGRGQICLVTGDAGAGKTTLATEFMRRAQAQQPDLVAAAAMGDPQTGASDPYLIFREVLARLTGDVETQLAQGTITQEGAKRLQGALRTSIDCLVEFGPDLIGLLVPGAGLAVQLAKIGIETGKRAGLLERMTQAPPEDRTRSVGPRSIDQGQIYEQYAKVLNALSQHAPLLLILDDLQWADNSSIDLLFHLTRRIEGSRIFIIAMLRPAEIALGRAGERHPLERVMSEVKRYYGDVVIDLDEAARSEGVVFVDALLDSEPNALGSGFRRALLARTGGNPLFAVELLREMEEQGDLRHDALGRWIADPGLDWSTLPARAEGVIESRISRLTTDLLEALKLASVQGDAFTAEVVAQIRKLNARDFLRQLSSELEKRHRLVTAQGQERVGEQRLSQYQFQNRLFQQYLYAGLDATERTYLHEDIGCALEALYGERSDEIAPRLAWHFEQAGVAEKAGRYLQRAGAQAAERSAHVEAIDFFTRALAVTPAEAEEQRFALVLGRVKAYHRLGRREEQAQDVGELERLAVAADDAVKFADAACQRADYEEVRHEYAAASTACQRAINAAQAAGDAEREIRAKLLWAAVLHRQGDYRAALEQAALAAHQAEGAGFKLLWADSLRKMGTYAHSLGDLTDATAHVVRAQEIYHDLGDRYGEGKVADALAWLLLDEGNYLESRRQNEFALTVYRETGDRRGEALILNNLGGLLVAMGDLSAAPACFEQALPICREIGERLAEGAIHVNLSSIYHMQSKHEIALHEAEEAHDIFEAIHSPYGKSHSLLRRGHALLALQQFDAAEEAYQNAIAIHQQLGNGALLLEPQAGLARVRLGQGNASQALSEIRPVVAHVAAGQDFGGTEDPLWVYLTCYEVLRANNDRRANDFLAEGYRQLLDKAAKFGDARSRDMFLANIPSHREIIKAVTGVYPDAPELSATATAPASGFAPSPTAPETPDVTLSPAAALVVASLPADAATPAPIVASTPSTAPAPASTPASVPEPTSVVQPDPAGSQEGQPRDASRPKARRPEERLSQGSPLRTMLGRPGRAIGVGLAAVLILAAGIVLLARYAEGRPLRCLPACGGAELAGRNLAGARMVGVNLAGANLYGARLAGARLTAATLVSATLAAADLSYANLRGADLREANLRGANLAGADLTSADLRGAALSGAALTNTDLTDADLTRANLAAAHLEGAILTGIHYDSSTRWPHGFSPRQTD